MKIIEQGRKFLSWHLKRDNAIVIKTGSEDDYIEIRFEGMTSEHQAKIGLKLSENIIVENRKTRKVRTL